MTSTQFNKVISRSARVPHSRAALALANVLSDPRTRDLFGSKTLDTEPAYFTTLLEDPDVKAAWDNYTNIQNVFPSSLADGTASLNGYRHYSAQDAIYLEYYVQVRLEAIIASGDIVSPDELSKFIPTVSDGLTYAVGALNDLSGKLGVPSGAIQQEWLWKSVELNASIEHYQAVVNGQIGPPGTAQPYTDIYFALLPCIKGYYTIAAALSGLEEPQLVTNTLYYSMWIQPNTDPSYVQQYDTFLEVATQNATDTDWRRWRDIFKRSCENENNFFRLATGDYENQPFNVITDGIYTISPFGNTTEFLTATDSGDVAVSEDGNSKWEFKNGLDGYTVMNVATNQYLTYSSEGTVPYKVQTTASTPGPQWPINPIYNSSSDAINGYHLFAPGHLNLVLEWSGSDGNLSVSVMEQNNTNINNETWVLTGAT